MQPGIGGQRNLPSEALPPTRPASTSPPRAAPVIQGNRCKTLIPSTLRDTLMNRKQVYRETFSVPHSCPGRPGRLSGRGVGGAHRGRS